MVTLTTPSRKTVALRLWLAIALAFAVTAVAQEPERKPEVVPEQKAQQPKTEPKTVPPEKAAKPEAAPKAVNPEAQKSDDAQKTGPQQKPEPRKPGPERKGGIQNAEATKADAEKGSTANLGTDVVAVRTRIEAALSSDPSLKGTAFNLNVTDDTIEITGVANSGRDRTAARRIVQSFSGNLRVKDRITVAGAAPASATPVDSKDKSDKPKSPGDADADADALAKPESDEQQSPQKKANKPKKDPPKHGDQAEDPRR